MSASLASTDHSSIGSILHDRFCFGRGGGGGEINDEAQSDGEGLFGGLLDWEVASRKPEQPQKGTQPCMQS